jgi:hypothetical protein
MEESTSRYMFRNGFHLPTQSTHRAWITGLFIRSAVQSLSNVQVVMHRIPPDGCLKIWNMIASTIDAAVPDNIEV